MSLQTNDELLAAIERSALLSDDDLKIAGALGVHLSALDLGKRLVSKKYLTRWQARELLHGRTDFHIGEYKLLDKLGEGGMGTVYLARQGSLGRTVALKVMSADIASEPGLAKRFMREAEAMGKLRHPNIVTAFDVDQSDGALFLVIEYIPGHDLSYWLNQQQSLPIDWCCECIRQAAEGLQHAFEQGLIHRDIKPGNLLIVGSGTAEKPQLKILDLGLARFADHHNDERQGGRHPRGHLCPGVYALQAAHRDSSI